jgi:hypothetical protein
MTGMRIAGLLTLAAFALAGLPPLASAGCLVASSAGLAERLTAAGRPRGGPISEARRLQPVNGTGGFSVFGADTVGKGGFSLGVNRRVHFTVRVRQ